MIAPASAMEPNVGPRWAARRRAIRRRRLAEMVLLTTAFVAAFAALAGPTIVVAR